MAKMSNMHNANQETISQDPYAKNAMQLFKSLLLELKNYLDHTEKHGKENIVEIFEDILVSNDGKNFNEDLLTHLTQFKIERNAAKTHELLAKMLKTLKTHIKPNEIKDIDNLIEIALEIKTIKVAFSAYVPPKSTVSEKKKSTLATGFDIFNIRRRASQRGSPNVVFTANRISNSHLRNRTSSVNIAAALFRDSGMPIAEPMLTKKQLLDAFKNDINFVDLSAVSECNDETGLKHGKLGKL
ncbi:hypothetical protein HK100_008896 [Physocladia obscura]|uniref:Uncharacterized protein n=1 Tax=Physocladia obscura TaxID=109957 RepID=A0AAD5T3R4_9FUNG|nr:hypothetical protein HK100_008896 [Physocladia obscura]